MRASGLIKISLLLILVLLLGIGAILGNQVYRYFLKTYQLRLDPTEQAVYEFIPAGPDTLRHRVVVFGDSRAREWKIEGLPDSFLVINRGINSQTTAQCRLRAQPHLYDLNPQYVLIQMGINDLKMIPLFPNKKEEIIQNCRSNWKTLLNQCTQNGYQVIITTIFPTDEIPFYRKWMWSSDVEEAIEEINDFLRNYDHPHVQILDSDQVLRNSSGELERDYYRDELHLNSQGYQQLNAVLIPLLEQRSSPPDLF